MSRFVSMFNFCACSKHKMILRAKRKKKKTKNPLCARCINELGQSEMSRVKTGQTWTWLEEAVKKLFCHKNASNAQFHVKECNASPKM